MPFALRFTPGARRTFQQLRESAERRPRETKAGTSRRSGSPQAAGLFKQVAKTLRFLRDNPRHPSLRTHEYGSISSPFDTSAKVFEAYAQNRTPGAYRVFWCYGPAPGEITIIAITPHP